MSNCVFCKIINGEFSTNKIHENELYLAFLDQNQSQKGHTLVVPKRHVETFDQLDLSKETELLTFIDRTIEILKGKYNFTDYKIVINNGKKAGQEVFHLHIHIIPHY